jgi:hypothetical protein
MQLPEQEDLEIPLQGKQGPEGNFYTAVENDVQEPGAKLKNADLSATSSKYPPRPRTWAAGYKYDEETATGTMTVVFRDDRTGGWGVWWNYYEVPLEMWQGFDEATSKGEYLRDSGLDNWYNMGPADPGRLGGFEVARLKAVLLGARNRYGKTS